MRWWLARGREDGGGAPLRGVRVESYRSSLPRRLSRCDKMASVDGGSLLVLVLVLLYAIERSIAESDNW